MFERGISPFGPTTTTQCNTYLIQSDDIGMLKKFHDLNLSSHLPAVLRIKLCLVNDLDGNLNREQHIMFS